MACTPGRIARVKVSFDGGQTYAELGRVVDGSISGNVDELECTSHDSPGVREYIPNFRDETMDVSIRWDEDSLTHLTRRNRNLVRANNLRRGLTRADEKPPDDHWRRRFPELEEKLLDEYYKFKGWNSDGVPTRETLEELDLDYVADDLEARGILLVTRTATPKAGPQEASP